MITPGEWMVLRKHVASSVRPSNTNEAEIVPLVGLEYGTSDDLRLMAGSKELLAAALFMRANWEKNLTEAMARLNNAIENALNGD